MTMGTNVILQQAVVYLPASLPRHQASVNG
jgi:hypothetical protein